MPALFGPGIVDIKTWNSHNDGVPGLAQLVECRLLVWYLNAIYRSLPVPFISDELAHAMKIQDNVGWDAFYFGAVAHALGVFQHGYLLEQGRCTTGVMWMSQLVCKVWDLQRAIWDHCNGFVHKGTRSL